MQHPRQRTDVESLEHRVLLSAVIAARGVPAGASAITIAAGQAVFINGLSSGGTDQLSARYEWDFGDPLGRYNNLVGFNAAHIYDVPSPQPNPQQPPVPYTLTLTLRDSNGAVSSTATFAVTVTANLPGERVIYVDSQAGNDSGLGTDPTTPIKTIGRAQAILATSDYQDGTRILLRRGQTFETTSDFQTKAYHDIIIGAYGSGDRPIYKMTTNASGATTSGINTDVGCFGVTIQDISFKTDLASAPLVRFHNMPGNVDQAAIRPDGENIAIRNCSFSRVDDCITTTSGKFAKGLLVQDNTVPEPDVAGRLVYADGGEDHVYLGNYMADSTVEANIRTTSYSTVDSMNVRHASPIINRVLVAFNELHNPDTPGGSTKGGSLNFRDADNLFVYQNRIFDDPARIGHDNDTYWDRSDYAVFDGNFFELNTNTQDASHLEIHSNTAHVMVRNNVFHHVTGSKLNGILINGERTATTQLGTTTITTTVKTSDVRILHNTAVVDAVQGAFIVVDDPVAKDPAMPNTGVAINNNLTVLRNTSSTFWSVQLGIGTTGADESSLENVGTNVWGPRLNDVTQPVITVHAAPKNLSDWNRDAPGSDLDYIRQSTINAQTYIPSPTADVNVGRYRPGTPFDRRGELRSAQSTTLTAGALQRDPASVVSDRHVFYNNSYYDARYELPDPQGGAQHVGNDNYAIAPDKSALLPGHTATFANYTTYSRGLNGVMVDFNRLPRSPVAADFDFKVYDASTSTWVAAPVPQVSTEYNIPLGGAKMIDRVKFIWPDYGAVNAISNTWLQVTVKPTASTGLAAADVFYFGNLMGDTGDSTSSFIVVANDYSRTKAAYDAPGSDEALITSIFDHDRDGVFDVDDYNLSQNNFFKSIPVLTV